MHLEMEDSRFLRDVALVQAQTPSMCILSGRERIEGDEAPTHRMQLQEQKQPMWSPKIAAEMPNMKYTLEQGSQWTM